ncbi:MAG TPA: glycerophosphodiester phosphodiesterase [Caldithrix abyssi]|uniref:Glycerophosphodiester phosphodiesterase n=1 Tax=Caldithrix abyssi TaxID=187145 RepID=A0A7V5RPU9_CALAY|nr:glycerophosphodiester phosphodiesterase [Caldithrix abyssi]
MKQNIPYLISHRGRADHSFVENTIEAFEQALAQGANGLEIDVQLCGSGEIIVFHDFYLKRLFNRRRFTWSTPLKELRAWGRANSGRQDFYIPTLNEFIEHFKGTVPVNLDAKVFLPFFGPLAKYLVRTIKASGYRSQFWDSSFNPMFIRMVKHNGADIQTGFLFSRYDILRKLSEPLWHSDFWHPKAGLIDDAFIKMAREHNKKIFTWTVNDPAEWKRLSAYPEIRGIITDKTHLMRKEIDQELTKKPLLL